MYSADICVWDNPQIEIFTNISESQPKTSSKCHTVFDKETNQCTNTTEKETCDKTNNNEGKYITLSKCWK